MFTRVIYTILLVSFSFALSGQTKRALVIGLGEQLDLSWNKINGDKDIPYVLEYLGNAGYKDITVLKNSEATKSAIIAAFKSLALSCRANDIVYVHFSGHGQQMRDLGNDEMDKKDECWIPYDAYMTPSESYKGEKHLTDDEVNVLIHNIYRRVGEGGKILVVVDACHSGSSTRGEGEVIRGVKDIFVAAKSYFDNLQENDFAVENEEMWITLSACGSGESNIEMVEPSAGKLTYAIYKIAEKGISADNEKFFKEISEFIDNNTGSRPQVPAMTGVDMKYSISDIL